jgi:release factor glutamine methyltransferase
MDKKLNFKGLTIYLHPEVYEPAEDTFLLLDAIDIESDDFVFEIGTGTGIIGLYCSMLGADVICSDINPFAVELTKRNYLVNQKLLNGNFEVRSGHLFSVLDKNEKFDKIIFNPPYLPTSPSERVGGWFDKSVDGGADGLSVTKRFIEGIGAFLEKKGKAFFVFSSYSDKKILESYLREKKLIYNIVKSIKFDDEEIFVFCINLK